MGVSSDKQIDGDLRYLGWRCGLAAGDVAGAAGGDAPGGARRRQAGERRTPAVRVPADTSRLFHLVPVSEAEAVIRDGIHAGGDGWIYCFTEPKAAEVIAREQLFARRYAVFQIDLDGLEAPVEADVAVWVWEPYQRVVRQRHVQPKYLLLMGVYEVARRPAERDYRQGERWGWSRERTEAIFDLSDRFVTGEISAEQVNEALRRLRHQHPQPPQHAGATEKLETPPATQPHGTRQLWNEGQGGDRDRQTNDPRPRPGTDKWQP